jgi:hypothetical protein
MAALPCIMLKKYDEENSLWTRTKTLSTYFFSPTQLCLAVSFHLRHKNYHLQSLALFFFEMGSETPASASIDAHSHFYCKVKK